MYVYVFIKPVANYLISDFMASPVPKFPVILENLLNKGYKTQCRLDDLRREIIMETGAMKDDTIKNIIQTMEYLNLIVVRSGIVTIVPKVEKKDPDKMTIQEEQVEIDKRLDNLT